MWPDGLGCEVLLEGVLRAVKMPFHKPVRQEAVLRAVEGATRPWLAPQAQEHQPSHHLKLKNQSHCLYGLSTNRVHYSATCAMWQAEVTAHPALGLPSLSVPSLEQEGFSR